MLTVGETNQRLAPKVEALAGLLREDPDLVAVGAAVRLSGVDHEVRLERQGMRLLIRAGHAQLYRGPLAAWYGRRSDRQTGRAA